MRRVVIAFAVVVLGVGFLWAAVECPAPVKAAVDKAYPGSTVKTCKQENEKGTVQYEVKLTTKDGKALEADVAPDGAILQTEEKIAVGDLPKAVLDAFRAKYGDSKVAKAERIVKAAGTTEYELAFTAGGTKKQVTISQDGKVLEEESAEKPAPKK